MRRYMTPNEYWESDDAHLDRKFYTAFCMLESACSDYALGVKLQHENRLNWACTMLYYSLVHAARLIVFLKTGDFPIRHKDLGALFSNGSLSSNVKTWIGKRENRERFQQEEVEVKPIPMTEFRLNWLSVERQRHRGEILDNACKLRDDATYEGLLISHEYTHAVVTDCFERLASAFQKASEELLPEMVRAFKDFIDSCPRSRYWYAFLNWKSGPSEKLGWGSEPDKELKLGPEGLYYLKASLKHRGADRQAISNIFTRLKELTRAPDFDVGSSEKVYDNIRMRTFGLKNMLMWEFREKIDELERLLEWDN